MWWLNYLEVSLILSINNSIIGIIYSRFFSILNGSGNQLNTDFSLYLCICRRHGVARRKLPWLDGRPFFQRWCQDFVVQLRCMPCRRTATTTKPEPLVRHKCWFWCRAFLVRWESGQFWLGSLSWSSFLTNLPGGDVQCVLIELRWILMQSGGKTRVFIVVEYP